MNIGAYIKNNQRRKVNINFLKNSLIINVLTVHFRIFKKKTMF